MDSNEFDSNEYEQLEEAILAFRKKEKEVPNRNAMYPERLQSAKDVEDFEKDENNLAYHSQKLKDAIDSKENEKANHHRKAIFHIKSIMAARKLPSDSKEEYLNRMGKISQATKAYNDHVGGMKESNMGDVRELLKSILTGKDYNDAFSQVMANKVGNFLDQQRERVAQEIFTKTDSIEEANEDNEKDVVVSADYKVSKSGKKVRAHRKTIE